MGRINDFVAVHDGDDDVMKSFTVLRESLGITNDLMQEFIEWADTVIFTDTPSPDAAVLFGLIMGLIASDHD